ncbi:MAG: gamma-glutamylcyclotransferase family protein [Aminipila sp.]
MTKKIYAAYGINTNILQMNKCCPKAKPSGLGILEGYKLTFRGNRIGFANIEKCKEGQVPLVIWDITKDCEKKLDLSVKYPDFYVKKIVDVLIDGEYKKAMLYVLGSGYESFVAIPDIEYFKTIEEGYEGNKISMNYLFEAMQNTYLEISKNSLKLL